MRIYIIRHGDPDYARDSLTPRGEKKALALASYLEHERIAVFCHGGFGPAWVGVLLDIPLPLMWAGFFMHTTSVTCILMEERIQGIATPRCLFYGALPHLYKEDIKPSQAGIIGNYE